MEFEFQKSACPCLETVLREVQNVEQTQEIKLPDGMPDIGRVLPPGGIDHPPGEGMAQRQRLLFRRDDGLDSLRAGGWQRGSGTDG